MTADLDLADLLERRRIDERQSDSASRMETRISRAVRRHRDARGRDADRGGRDDAAVRIDREQAPVIHVGDIDALAVRRDGEAERPALERDSPQHAPLARVDHREIFAFRARHIGARAIRRDGDAGRLAADRERRDRAHRREIDDGDDRRCPDW